MSPPPHRRQQRSAVQRAFSAPLCAPRALSKELQAALPHDGVLHLQVAKDLIEHAGKAGGGPSRPSFPRAELTAPESLLKLLQYRQQALAAQIAGAIGAVSKAAASQGAGANACPDLHQLRVCTVLSRVQAGYACPESAGRSSVRRCPCEKICQWTLITVTLQWQHSPATEP